MTIRISNISHHWNKERLTRLFAKYGKVQAVCKFGKKAFVRLGSRAAAQSAVKDMIRTKKLGGEATVDLPRHQRTKTICHTHLGFLRLL